jgi:pyruvyltransferase
MPRHRFERLISYHLKERLPNATLGALKGNGMKAYWYRETVNFGDLLTPVVLRHHGFSPIHAYPKYAQLASTGSILEHLPDEFGGFILGSGFIDSDSRRRFPNARILAVRGTHTRERIEGLGSNIPLGDPGLYAAKLMGSNRNATSALGIIPHHINLDSPYLAKIKVRSPDLVRIISPVAQPEEVFSQMQECELILSSSMHGLILADALGKPSIWCGEKLLLGGNFKFFDYASAVGRTDWAAAEVTGDETLAELKAMASCASADKVAECQQVLSDTFDKFAREVKR